MQPIASPGGPGEQRRLGREVDIRRAPWDVSVVVIGLPARFLWALGNAGCTDHCKLLGIQKL